MRTNYIREIHWFDAFNGWNPHAFLSNFYEGDDIVIDGIGYATGEHAFQAYKTGDEKWFNAIKDAKDPGTAKALGRRAPLRPDWELVKYDVMRLVIVHKFTLAREEGQLLLMTGDALLTEGTYWGDDVWGVKIESKKPFSEWRGRNWLGTMLMARRAELRAMQAGAPAPRVAELSKFSSEIVDPGYARKRQTFYTTPPAQASFHPPLWDRAPTWSQQPKVIEATPEPAKTTPGNFLPFDETQTKTLLAALADMRVTLEEMRKAEPCDLDEIEEILTSHLEELSGIDFDDIAGSDLPLADDYPAAMEGSRQANEQIISDATGDLNDLTVRPIDWASIRDESDEVRPDGLRTGKRRRRRR